MAIERALVRTTFAALLRADLVHPAPSPLAAAVEQHQIGVFGGRSPVVVVSSAGVGRVRTSFQGAFATVYVNVDVFTLYTDPATNWDEADAEARADALEARIAAIVAAHQEHVVGGVTLWSAIDYADRSQVGSIADLKGTEYKREHIPLAFACYG